MNAYRKAIALGGVALLLGLQPLVFGQDASRAPAPGAQRGPTVEQRVAQLESTISMLQTELRRRTDVAGPDDRISRDMNLDNRLRDLERQIQQVNNSVMELQRQLGDAVRAASQAQSDAMLAQQIARDAQSRIN
jgi:predicted RNase H-like nuclease (RuvC/YqgF family)